MKPTEGALLIVALMIAWSIYKANRNPANDFNLLDLLMDNGRVSRIACAFLTTMIITSWIMVDLQIHGKMDVSYFAAYSAAWISPIVAKLLSSNPPADPK